MPLVDMTASGGGGGSPTVTVLETWDATSDLTSQTITSAGTSTLYAADGTTPRASIVVTAVGNLAAGWEVTCDASASPPILISGVKWSGSSTGGYVSVQVEPVFSASPDWSQDRWFAEVLYSGIATSGDASNTDGVRMGCAPVGTVVGGTGAFDLIAYDDDTSTWKRETWTDSDVVGLTYTTLVSSSCSMLIDSLRHRLALDNGGTDFADDLTSGGSWDIETIGEGQISSSETMDAGQFSTGFGAMMLAHTTTTAGPAEIGLSKIRLSVGAPKEA